MKYTNVIVKIVEFVFVFRVRIIVIVLRIRIRGTGKIIRIRGRDVGFEVDPKLINPGGGGTIGDPHLLATLDAYQLQESSPLIDKGLDLRALFGIEPGKHDFYRNVLPQGAKFDVGAHEFTSRRAD